MPRQPRQPRTRRPRQVIIELLVRANPWPWPDRLLQGLDARGVTVAEIHQRGNTRMLLLGGPLGTIVTFLEFLDTELGVASLPLLVCDGNTGYRLPGRPFREAQWLNAAPDIEDPANPGTFIRPTAWGNSEGAPILVFAGWPSHTTETEPT